MTAAAPPESAQGFSLGAPPSLRAWVDRVATVLLGLATGTLIVLVLGALAGYQAMVDRSDSMRPEIRAGDLIVVRQAAARTAAVGDVVTFWDPAEKRSVTHRVVERRPQAGAISFTTPW